ncbi:NADH dehydrogenase (ubiquinone) complex I, assembly factor 6 [Hylaeus anthracinus]|uniref:NADH dehydrogenase (ubiquinone) complex I, assembly factor 6 n=1 Tax=Hylaeus anthracinus TaxID=313031 RepID=UPI0023B9D531|nr:NADH dehydrogenase (ubiquinone) complex I, assembly factor 6 [Hylaeus anthracinus]
MNASLLNIERNALLQISRYSSVATKQTPAEYCFELVRKLDYENFLCTLLLKRTARSSAFAIRAFNVEVAQVQDQVHDYKIGQMRLKFWADGLSNTYKGSPPRSPVFLELHRTLQKCSLSKHYFKRLIDARLERLNNSLIQNINEIEKYAEYSTSSIYYLLLEAHGITNINADHVASHMGKAHGIVNLIRSIPYNAKKRVNMLPQDILMKYGVSTEAVFQGEPSKDLKNVIFDIASCGKLHLDAAISLKSKMEKNAGLIFLPIVCLETYLNELRKSDFNVFDTRLQKRNSLLPVRLYWKKLMY